MIRGAVRQSGIDSDHVPDQTPFPTFRQGSFDMTEIDTSATGGSASVRVDASPEAVFAYLTDLSLLPGLSPENVRCEFLDGATELSVGVKFRGHNKARDYEWHADCVVTVLEANRAFAYDVPPGFEHTTTWSYEIEADGEGSIVTERFNAPMLAMPDVYPGTIEGRRDNLEKGCEMTMANLKQALEAI